MLKFLYSMRKQKIDAFMAKTHALLSVILFMLLLMLPVEVVQNLRNILKSDVVLFLSGLVLLVGSSLLLDLDNTQSKAKYALGVIGDMMTLFFQSSSRLIWSVYHLKGDKLPDKGTPNPHRLFWHTLFVGLGLTAVFYFGVPDTGNAFYTDFANAYNEKAVGEFFLTHSLLFITVFFVFLSSFVGSSMAVGILNKLLFVPSAFKLALPFLLVVYSLTLEYRQLKIIGLMMGLGYTFHVVEDYFTNSGVPLLWPIPVFGKAWKKFSFIVTVSTGSTLNSMIDIICVPIAAFLVMQFLVVK